MFNATCLIKTDIDTVNKCMGQNPYNPETFLQNFASRLTSFDDPLLNIYPTSEIAGNIEDEDVILGLREPQKLIEWAKTMKERTQCMAMAEFSAALQKHKAEGIDITKPMYTCLRSIEMDSNESYLLRYAAELFDNHPNPECGELFYDGELCFFIPFGGTEFDHDERIRCAHAARVVENYLDNVAYGKKVETYIRELVEAASIDGAISESNTEV